MTERIEALTDVSTALDSTEHRRPLRAFPRYSFSGQYTLADNWAGTSYQEHTKRAEFLEVLRTAHKVKLPIGPAMVYRGSGSALPALDMLVNASTGAALQEIVGFDPVAREVVTGQPGYWTAPWLWAAPLLEVELQDAREIEHRTNQLHIFQLSAQLTGFDELFSPAITVSEPFTAPAQLVRHNWISSMNESLAATTERFDNGHLPLAMQRYIKRSVSLDIFLTSRADILAFRRFIFACQGRYRSFLWQPRTDLAASRWRLGSDTTEIEYTTRNVAKCRLMLTRTDQ